MPAPSWPRRLAAFVLAVLFAVAWGSVVQTQINLADLTALGVDIGTEVRLRTTAQDLLHFAPLYAAIVAPAFAIAFVIAGQLSKRFTRYRTPLFALAGFVALIAAIRLVDALVPPPVLIAATRSFAGMLAVVVGGVLGGFGYVLRSGAA